MSAAGVALVLLVLAAACGSDPPPTVSPSPVATPVPAEAQAGAPLAFDPAVVRGTLGNGLTYYVRRNEEPRGRAYLSLVVKVGSVLEEEAERGLAHFVEHMAFNGTERFAKQQIVDYLQSLGSAFGPDLNAQTSHEATVYWLEVPTGDPAIVEAAFQILSDWAYAIAFDPAEVELERGVVLEEWRLWQGFTSRLLDSYYPLLFGASRYAERSPIGLPEVVETASAEDLRAFYDRWYRPNLMAVVAVGDFDPELIEKQVRRHFAPPPEGAAPRERAAAPPAERPRLDVPEHDAPRFEVFSDPEAPATQVSLIRKVAAATDGDTAAFRRGLAERLAFMMLNARLYERSGQDDRPWLAAGGGRYPLTESLDSISFTANVEPDSAERGLAALLRELQRVRRHGFTNGELTREKANLLNEAESAYRERDQLASSQLAVQYGAHFLRGTPVPGAEGEWELSRALLPQISLTEVNEAADSWTELRNSSILVTRPVGGEATDPELAAAVQAQLEAAPSIEVEPYHDSAYNAPLLSSLPTPGSIVAEERHTAIEAREWTLSNGVRVVARQTDFRNDEVVFRAFSPGGTSLVPDDDYVSALYAADLATGNGPGQHAGGLRMLLAGKDVWVDPYIDDLFEGFTGGCSPQDLETLFQLITLLATEQRFDGSYAPTFEAWARSVVEAHVAWPDAILFDTLDAALSKDHFRRRPLTLDLFEEFDAERAAAVYTERFADMGEATFVFVGAFDWEELRTLTETYLASLPATDRAESWRDVGIDPPAGRVERVVRSGIEQRSTTALAFAGEMAWSPREAVTLAVLGEIVGIRLHERLREALGGTYYISVDTVARKLPDPEYRVSIFFGSDPDRADELLEEVLVELAWLHSGGEQRYLDTARELLRTARKEQARDNDFWLDEIEAALQHGEALAEINRFDEWLGALTLEQIAAAARRYLPTDHYIRVVLLPEDE